MKSARTLDSGCSFQFEAYVDLIAAAAALAALARALG